MTFQPTNNRLTALAADIRAAQAELACAAQTAAAKAIAIGHMLIEAKTKLRHGAWLPWLSEHAAMSERTAQGYMRLARSGMKSETVAEIGIRAALALTRPARIPRLAADEFIIGHTDTDPETEESRVLYLWPANDEGFRWAVVMVIPAGGGAPQEVLSLEKPFDAVHTASVLAAIGFPATASFTIRKRATDGGFLDWLRTGEWRCAA